MSRQKIRSLFERKQQLAGETGSRYYGDGGTIHGTTHLDVCLGADSSVVQVWFRCQLLPFTVSRGTRELDNPPIELTGVEVRDER